MGYGTWEEEEKVGKGKKEGKERGSEEVEREGKGWSREGKRGVGEGKERKEGKERRIEGKGRKNCRGGKVSYCSKERI